MRYGLQSLSLKPEYRSDSANLLGEFFLPCLAESIRYDRAVGYFTSDGLALAARGLFKFIEGEGAMRLVASPVLSAGDEEAISRGYRARDDVIERALLSQLASEKLSSFHERRLACLAWLVAEERLEIRVAIRTRDGSAGIYHEKMGIFADAVGAQVAFSGSSNETAGGLLNNFEQLDVFWSWADEDRVQLKADNFERLWNDETDGLDVLPFPDAAMEKLLSVRPSSPPKSDPEAESQSAAEAEFTHLERPRFPAPLQLRDYQQEAVDAWLAKEGRGILEMATGTGKTLTALSAAEQLFQQRERMAILVLAPYQHLVDQWVGQARRFGMRPLKAYGDSSRWRGRLREKVDMFESGIRPFFSVVATHASATLDHLVEPLARISSDVLLVADEVHHLGAEGQQAALGEEFRFRLGLSATPSRWLDEEGTAFLESYFGGVVFSFGLGPAIESGYLTPYEYFPHIVNLHPDELDEYVRLTSMIARALEGGADDRLGHLLSRRASLLNSARDKLDVLSRLLEQEGDLHHALIYCAPGQIDDVVHLMGRVHGLRVARFTARERPEQRLELLRRFDSGDLQALAAMRCLDEGVDVPSTETAYLLASSSNPVQFVQRRGRVLRTWPGKRSARIHDLLVIPLVETSPQVTNRIVARELGRFSEFASLATNRHTASHELRRVAEAHGFDHIA